jgi:hypothetical protein
VAFQQLISPQAGSSGVLVSGLDITQLSEWHRLEQRMRHERRRQEQEGNAQLRSISADAAQLTSVQLPRLATLLSSFIHQPAQSLVPQLRNRLGHNIQHYVQEAHKLVNQIKLQQQRYERQVR